ncbi:MAG: DUF2330 domain-containing protein [Polyangiaceae bacterium]
MALGFFAPGEVLPGSGRSWARRLGMGALGSALALTAWPTTEAHACGGCIAPPPSESTTPPLVNAHRMAVSISTTQTVLWDQIRYSGEPSEFAWVLPIRPGARVEVASDAFFDVLEASTSTRVNGPWQDCLYSDSQSCAIGAPGVGFGCGDGADVVEDPTEDGVDVVHHGSAGPYEVAILKSEEPGALVDWLQSHDYAVSDDIRGVVDQYVSEGFDFVALRLVPGAGVSQMTPVRVITPGAGTALPLRMVAVGAGPKVALTLFVFAEARMTAANFPEGRVNPNDLIYDFSSDTTNYGELRDAVFAQNQGRTFLAPYALQGTFFGEAKNPRDKSPILYRTTDGESYSSIAGAVVQQAFLNGESSSTECGLGFEDLATSVARVVDPCDESGACREIDPENEIDARTLMCDPPIGSDLPFDDLAIAMMGLHPRDVWVTRLEANLTREQLDEDLELAPLAYQYEQPGFLQASYGVNGACGDEDAPPALSTIAQRSNLHARGAGNARAGVALAIGALAIAMVGRRLRALKRRSEP